MKYFVMVSAACFLAACATNAPVEHQANDYNPTTQARIRLYGQNQKPTLMISNIDCANNYGGKKVNVGGSMSDAFTSMTGIAKNSSIGIPPTEASRNIGKNNGLLSRALFREFAIDANKPVNLKASYIGLTTSYDTPTSHVIMQESSCHSPVASFVPQAGHDYEVIGLSGNGCNVAVYDIGKNGATQPVAVQDAFICPSR